MTNIYYSDEAEVSVLGGMLMDPKAISLAVSLVRAKDFHHIENQTLFQAMATLYARDEVIDVVTLVNQLNAQGDLDLAGGHTYISQILDAVPTAANVEYHCEIVRQKAAAHELKKLCAATTSYLDGGGYSDGGQAIADRLASKILQVYAHTGVGAQEDRESLLDELWGMAFEENESGVAVPWPKLNDQIGPLVAGEIVGVSAFSGQGKTQLASNWFAGLCGGGTPCVYFSTEMGKRLIQRTAASESLQSQRRAEKNIWADDEWGRGRYQAALSRMKEWPFEVVTKPNISPGEIVRRTKVLRQKWPGETVVIFVDHCHRLDYGTEDPDKLVGRATKLFKDAAMADDEGGLIFILLYQPRKPSDVELLHKPVAAHQIRGSSMVWNELDIHLSPYRAYVETDPSGKTPWGTPVTRLNANGAPIVMEPTNPSAQLCDNHVFMSIDKRRIGGAGPTVFLSFHAPSGRISEGGPTADHDRQLELKESGCST